jgi:hypothetical protein
MPGNPAQGEELVIQVSATAIDTKTNVEGMTRYSRRKSRPINRTTVFMRATPYVSRGQKDYGFTISGLLIADDAGQQMVRDAEAAGTTVFITVLHDGTNGFMQECLVGNLSHDASPDTMQETGWELTGVDEPTEVGTGPII